jgi:hypothetical protein
MIDFDIFRRIFDSSFWRTLSDSLVPYKPGEKPQDKKQFLEQLFVDITQRQYASSVPRDYIVSNKHNHVTRIVPTFSYRDACVYFFCIKRLEDHIAVNRIEGTFGGWRLGNPIRQKEDVEIPSGAYVPTLSYNRAQWGKNWQEFQKRAFEYSYLDDFDYFLKFDIANFHDTINLHLLEDKIRLVTQRDYRATIDLLFSFLGSWNRKFEGYTTKTVGLPQDEISDCSRILANFYLQDYDAVIHKLCANAGARYLRYADDQIIFCNSAHVANSLLIEACKELFKINLSVNSGKVDRFETREHFDEYWAFEMFGLLARIIHKKAQTSCKSLIE